MKFVAFSLLLAQAYASQFDRERVRELKEQVKERGAFEPVEAHAAVALEGLDAEVQADSRIVGGTPAAEGEYEFFASWLWRVSGGYTTACGGSLIAKDIILSAAHCLIEPVRNDRFIIGSHIALDADGAVVRSIESYVIHPGYGDTQTTTDNDFVIIKLNAPVEGDELALASPIKMDAWKNTESVLEVGEDLTTLGHGATSEGGGGSNVLLHVDVPLTADSTCRSMYRDYDPKIHLCAGVPNGGRDSCQGDSGGPIIRTVNGEQILTGVVSFGVGCARRSHHGVYARVSGVVDWIDSVVCGDMMSDDPICDDEVPDPTDAPVADPTESPVAAPPTESPVADPTESPVAAPATCEDDLDARFKVEGRNRHCKWLLKNMADPSIRSLCDTNEDVAEACGHTCGTCLDDAETCSDIIDYPFWEKNGRTRTCAWIYKKQVSSKWEGTLRPKWCLGDNDVLAATVCPRACMCCGNNDCPEPDWDLVDQEILNELDNVDLS